MLGSAALSRPPLCRWVGRVEEPLSSYIIKISGNFSALAELLNSLPRPKGSHPVSDDSRWIDETLAGERSSYANLVKKYQDRLFNSVFQVVGGREEAEDVVQEAFVQAFVKLSTFQGTSAFYTWIYRIAFNLAVSRRRKRRPEHSIDHLRE